MNNDNGLKFALQDLIVGLATPLFISDFEYAIDSHFNQDLAKKPRH